MSLVLNLSPVEEAQLSAAALLSGLAPEVFAAKLLREHLLSASLADELHQKLRVRQEQDNVTLNSSRTASELFAQWDRDAAQMTDEEREQEDRFWEDFQKGINITRATLGMRQL